jgi:DNA-binding transcriptional MocR family regulator
MIRGEVGRGTYVGPPPASVDLRQSFPTNGSSVVELGYNYAIYEQDPDVESSLVALARRPDLQNLMRYQPHAGLWSHRAAGAAWANRFAIGAKPETTIVCNGAQHALSIIFSTIAEPGDLIVTDTLTFPGMKGLANLLRLSLHGVAADEHGMKPDALTVLCKQRKPRAIYLMPTLHNPTGHTMPAQRRIEIARIAEQYDLAIVEDDISSHLVTQPPPPISTMAPERSYYITGLSKSVAGGVRIAYLVAPEKKVDDLSRTLGATCWMVAPLMAELATMWIEDGTADKVLSRKRAEAQRRQQLASRILDSASYSAGPQSFHLWLTLPRQWQSAAFTVEVRRRGVAVTSAEAFVVGGGRIPQAVRVCLGAAENRQQLEAGLKIVAATLASEHAECSAVV